MTENSKTISNNQKLVVVAGATGDLGQRICRYLVQEGARVRALTRANGKKVGVKGFTGEHIELIEVDYFDSKNLMEACTGAYCVVSALSGLGDVIVETQSRLLDAATQAGVQKFIPSDYCIDFRNVKRGQNRNLDFRREFAEKLLKSRITGTSVLSGMYSDLLQGQAPVILKGIKRIFFWGNADQKMDFTTIDNTAEFTAKASLDPASPRWLAIAGEEASMRDLKNMASEVSGDRYQFLRPGGLAAFKFMIKTTRTFSPGKNEVFPAWQGMQYLYDMLTGLPKFKALDNARYSNIRWTPVREVIAASL